MGILSDGGIEIKCPYCGATQEREFDVQMHYRWKNAHGVGIRIFCQLCRQWTDVTAKNGEVVKVEVVQKPTRSEIKELASLFTHADTTYFRKIQAAKRDIRETESIITQPRLYPQEVREAAQRHVSIMRHYVFDLERNRSEMYKEYHAELAKIGIVRK